jgi:hypothetical protein
MTCILNPIRHSYHPVASHRNQPENEYPVVRLLFLVSLTRDGKPNHRQPQATIAVYRTDNLGSLVSKLLSPFDSIDDILCVETDMCSEAAKPAIIKWYLYHGKTQEASKP